MKKLLSIFILVITFFTSSFIYSMEPNPGPNFDLLGVFSREIIYAMEAGNTKFFKELFKFDIRNSQGFKPLYIASRGGYARMVELFLNHLNLDINEFGPNGFTALHAASYYGHSDVVKVLLDKGADLSCKSKKEGFTPLHLASSRGHTAVVEILLEKIQEIDCEVINLEDNYKCTALHYACLIGAAPIVELLVINGAFYLKRNKNGLTPLAFACIKGKLDIIKILSSFYRKFTFENEDHRDYLMLAIEEHQLGAFKILLEEMLSRKTNQEEKREIINELLELKCMKIDEYDDFHTLLMNMFWEFVD